MASALAAVGGFLGTTGGAAAASLGSAALGAWSSNKAADKAAAGQREAAAINERTYNQARGDVLRLYDESSEGRDRAFRNSLGFISGAPAKQIAPLQSGNLMAQEQVNRGLTQTINAILGRPVDTSGFVPANVGTPDQYNFDLSGYMPAEPAPAPQPTTGIDPRVLQAIGNGMRI